MLCPILCKNHGRESSGKQFSAEIGNGCMLAFKGVGVFEDLVPWAGAAVAMTFRMCERIQRKLNRSAGERF